MARIRELWVKNFSQEDMLQTLRNEGFQISGRQLTRVRSRYRWMMRVPNGMRSIDLTPPQPTPDGGEEVKAAELGQAVLEVSGAAVPETVGQVGDIIAPSPSSPGPSMGVIVQGEDHIARMQQQRDHRRDTRTRGRPRASAGIPADPDAPLRSLSEMTVSEARNLLGLDDQLYHYLRDHFQVICEQAGIWKKTAAGSEWGVARNQLISKIPSLQIAPMDGIGSLALMMRALDVICCNFVKRTRTKNSRMTIGNAKNVLGIDPDQSRIIRSAFYQLLKADHYPGKLERSKGHWNELKNLLIQEFDLLTQVFILEDDNAAAATAAAGGSSLGDKHQALEVLCRDVLKRLRDDERKQILSEEIGQSNGSGLTILETATATAAATGPSGSDGTVAILSSIPAQSQAFAVGHTGTCG